MKRNLLRIVIVLLILTIAFSNLITFAAGVKETFTGDVSKVNGAATATQEILGTILDIVRLVGLAVAIIILTYIGIKFMLAAPSERANIKQYSTNYIIGAFILIGGVGFLTVIKDFALSIG